MIKVILDSNFLVANFDSRDSWHSTARSILKALAHPNFDLIHPDFVLGETISVVARRS
jgi:predicted nucleic acid-binding protein